MSVIFAPSDANADYQHLPLTDTALFYFDRFTLDGENDVISLTVQFTPSAYRDWASVVYDDRFFNILLNAAVPAKGLNTYPNHNSISHPVDDANILCEQSTNEVQFENVGLWHLCFLVPSDSTLEYLYVESLRGGLLLTDHTISSVQVPSWIHQAIIPFSTALFPCNNEHCVDGILYIDREPLLDYTIYHESTNELYLIFDREVSVRDIKKVNMLDTETGSEYGFTRSNVISGYTDSQVLRINATAHNITDPENFVLVAQESFVSGMIAKNTMATLPFIVIP